MTDVELVFELLLDRIGGRVNCDCCGCGDRFLTDKAVTWEELDESLSEGSVRWAFPSNDRGEVGGRGEKAPGRR